MCVPLVAHLIVEIRLLWLRNGPFLMHTPLGFSVTVLCLPANITITVVKHLLASCEESEKLSGLLLHAYYWVMFHAYCLDAKTFSDNGCVP